MTANFFKDKKYLFIIIPVLIVCILLSVFYLVRGNDSHRGVENSTDNILYSRRWMEHVMELVKKNKPAPSEAARTYAYVSSVYSDILLESNKDEASEGARRIINQIYPDDSAITDTFYHNLPGIRGSISLADKSNNILNNYLNREKTDGLYELKWDEIVPNGDGYWVKGNKIPYSPRSGQWKRWIVQGVFDVPPPPKYGSKEDQDELEKVKDATSKRDEEWNKKIIFWQGIPGTETPAGIWQNVMHDQIKSKSFDDLAYSKYQKVLAQSTADAFMECWKIKYEYWTARPSMRIPGLKISMPDPPFPSYPSGHSTISRTAAEVLASQFPEKRDYWLQMAKEAKDSRLYGGIHFSIDNEEGAKLGEKVGKEIVGKLAINN